MSARSFGNAGSSQDNPTESKANVVVSVSVTTSGEVHSVKVREVSAIPSYG
jgi:hypothetical protein